MKNDGGCALEDDLISEFMQAAKVVTGDIKWEHPPNTDTAKCNMVVFVPSNPSFNAKVCLTAHVSRLPEKYGFSLILGSIRVGALDVNPARSHINLITAKKESVLETHWQSWPDLEYAVRDESTKNHRSWWMSFLARYGIEYGGIYKKPPHYGGEQLRLF